MFRRSGKNPSDDNTAGSLYKEEASLTSPYKYVQQKSEPPSIFDAPHPHLAQDVRTFTEDLEKTVPHHFQGLTKEEQPETTLGESVTFRGELQFEKLLRIDGTFEGQLLSQGKVIVGPKGSVKANLNLREAVIEGKIEGNIQVQENLTLRGEASVVGDISAKTLTVDEGVKIQGYVRVPFQTDAPHAEY